jgi:hypothetical protein
MLAEQPRDHVGVAQVALEEGRPLRHSLAMALVTTTSWPAASSSAEVMLPM